MIFTNMLKVGSSELIHNKGKGNKKGKTKQRNGTKKGFKSGVRRCRKA